MTLDNVVVDHIKNHLIDIISHDNCIELKFDSDQLPGNFKEMPGFDKIIKSSVFYNHIGEEIYNNDTLALVENLKEILRKNDNVTKTPSEYYLDLINCVLPVGGIYSSYVEMVLAHIFMTDVDEFWRYNQDKKITVKLSEKSIAMKISPLLGFLYQPNRISINGIGDEELLSLLDNEDNLSFHEKIFLQKF